MSTPCSRHRHIEPLPGTARRAAGSGASWPRGFEHFRTIGLAVDRRDPVVAPHPDRRATVVRLDGDDWASLLALLVETRNPKHGEAGYTDFARARIAGWRALESRGQGGWFGVRERGRVVAALGSYVEARPGPDGRRIGRFQYVVTEPSARRRGRCGALVEFASRFAFEHLEADTLYILADADDVARRVYESCGYRVRSSHHGLERGSQRPLMTHGGLLANHGGRRFRRFPRLVEGLHEKMRA